MRAPRPERNGKDSGFRAATMPGCIFARPKVAPSRSNSWKALGSPEIACPNVMFRAADELVVRAEVQALEHEQRRVHECPGRCRRRGDKNSIVGHQTLLESR